MNIFNWDNYTIAYELKLKRYEKVKEDKVTNLFGITLKQGLQNLHGNFY